MPADLDRARGTLWGQAVGDAAGTTQEFSRGKNPSPFPTLNSGPQTDIVGGGSFGLDPGQVTDDTQMAVCLAESLAERRAYDARDAARRYVEWSGWAFDIGNQTRSVLGKIARGGDPVRVAYDLWEATDHSAAGNGSLMRVSPLPVFFAADPGKLRRAALDDSAVTHADPRCQLACAAFGRAVRHAIVTPGATPASMLEEALRELEEATPEVEPRIPRELVRSAADDLSVDLAKAAERTPDLESDRVHLYRHAGFVRVAFRLAFWELLHAPDFRAAILDVINRGGDADTNAAITGALFGSLAGERGIPEPWRKSVADACQHPKFARTPWADRYHPRRLFRVLE